MTEYQDDEFTTDDDKYADGIAIVLQPESFFEMNSFTSSSSIDNDLLARANDIDQANDERNNTTEEEFELTPDDHSMLSMLDEQSMLT